MITRQEKLVELLSENVRKPKPDSTRNIIKQAGYSPSSADKPGRILQARSFQELLEKYVGDDFVLRMLEEVLKQTENHMARAKAADLVFRIKGQYAPPKMPVDPYDTLTDKEIEEEIRKLEQAKLSKMIRNSQVTDGEVVEPDVAQPPLSDEGDQA